MRVILDSGGVVKGYESKYAHVEKRRNEIRKEINSYPLNIDRQVFKKTKAEKEEVKRETIRFKNKQK